MQNEVAIISICIVNLNREVRCTEYLDDLSPVRSVHDHISALKLRFKSNSACHLNVKLGNRV